MFDFHCHTVYSDGNAQPEALIQAAIRSGIKVLAITDHDTTLSYDVAQTAVTQAESDLKLIPGIELNTVWKNRHEVHVLGYFIDRGHAGLQQVIQTHQKARRTQMKQMADKLAKLARLNITYEAISACANPAASLGRPHAAQAIIKSGGAATVAEAFQKYLTPNAPTYQRRETVSPHEAVEAIYESGGIPVIAHPGDMPEIEVLVKELMDYGLRGLEAYHRSHSPGVIEFHCSLAERYGLIVTGGTDYHGHADNYPQALARLFLPGHLFEDMLTERDHLQQSSIRAIH
jgi:3',5'-nucleoside bisphosphate phosphatase